MSNVETSTSLSQIDQYQFMVTINDTQYDSSYVCSFYNAMITYSQDELVKINNRFLSMILKIMIRSIGCILQYSKINQNRYINNFLLSTNPYPNWHGQGIKKDLLISQINHPQHAIIYRSLNSYNHAKLINQLKKNNFLLIPTRQVYIFDHKLNDYIKKNNTQNDRRAFQKTSFQKVSHQEIKKSDYQTIHDLYHLLYVKKYSRHNPQFTPELIQYWHESDLLTFFALRDSSGILQGVVGIFESEAVITAPLVGYNTELPQELGLYRILIYWILKYSDQKKRCLNLSSGASQFKRLRGGQPFIEYMAIHIDHLPWYRRFIWKSIDILLKCVYIPILKRYAL